MLLKRLRSQAHPERGTRSHNAAADLNGHRTSRTWTPSSHHDLVVPLTTPHALHQPETPKQKAIDGDVVPKSFNWHAPALVLFTLPLTDSQVTCPPLTSAEKIFATPSLPTTFLPSVPLLTKTFWDLVSDFPPGRTTVRPVLFRALFLVAAQTPLRTTSQYRTFFSAPTSFNDQVPHHMAVLVRRRCEGLPSQHAKPESAPATLPP